MHRLAKSPSFTIAAILTLAVAIGANAVVFSAINGFVLRPLDLPREESLYHIERSSDEDASESYPNYVDLRDRTRGFESLGAEYYNLAWLSNGTEQVHASFFEVSGNYFDVLGVRPHLGRFFHASDEHGANSAPYIVLSYAYWHAHFHDDRNVIGLTVELSRHPFTIIGVAPPGFRGTVVIVSPDFFVPIVNQEQVDATSMLTDRAKRWLQVFGHIRPGVTTAQVTEDLNAIGASLAKSYPGADDKLGFRLTRTHISGDAFERPVHEFLIGLLLLAALILVAACANLGSLFAARTADRSREIALRLALGARRSRIMSQLFTEALLLSVAGGALGLWSSLLLLDALSNWRPFPQFAINLPIEPDVRVYAAALLLSVASGLFFGAVPVRQVLRTNPHELIKSGSRSTPDRRLTIRDLLLGVQIAVCALLVTSAAVAVRGLVRSLHGNFGFDPRNVLLVETDLAASGYRAERIPAMQAQMVDALKTIPGVTAVGLIAQSPPLHVGWNNESVFRDDETNLKPANTVAEPVVYSISPDYFVAAGTVLEVGRAFTPHDDASAPRVAIVNGVFAHKLFGTTANVLGRRFKMANGTRVEVVGLVQNGKYTANLAEEGQAAAFFPILQSPSTETWMVVRSRFDSRQIAPVIRNALRLLDAKLPAFIETWNRDMDAALFAPRVAAVSIGILGVMGAIVAITGILGLAAYSLSKQLKELGIRVALGAPRTAVLRATLSRAFKLLLWGSAVGLSLGIMASRVLGYIVYEATPRDPVVLAAAVTTMMVLGLVAAWLPARRALSLDPLLLLREE